MAYIGEGWCFFANGVSYIAVIIGLFLMDVKAHRPVAQAGSPISNVIEGFRFVLQNPPIHAILILLGIVSLTGMPYSVLMPIFADTHSARRPQSSRHPDGRHGSRRAHGRAVAGQSPQI